MRMAEVADLLNSIVARPETRAEGIQKFQEYVFNADQPPSDFSPDQWLVLGDLAYDLDYYVSDPRLRAEDPCYYGDERLIDEVRTALQRLRIPLLQ